MAKKPTQREKVLKVLQDANGGWVSGRYLKHGIFISEANARLTELRHEGYEIEEAAFRDEFGFRLHRLKPKATLF